MKRGAITPPPSRPDLPAVTITGAAALRGCVSFTLKDVRGNHRGMGFKTPNKAENKRKPKSKRPKKKRRRKMKNERGWGYIYSRRQVWNQDRGQQGGRKAVSDPF